MESIQARESPRDFAERALTAMLAHVDATAGSVTNGFPHYGDPLDGSWTTSPGGDWTGGFWNGMLWLAFHATRDERYRKAAHRWTTALAERAESDTVFRGFLFYYGAALGSILEGDELAHDVALRGARGLAASFNPAVGMLPLGTQAEEASDIGASEFNVDGMQASALLAWAARAGAVPGAAGSARTHALRNLEVFVRSDRSVCQSASVEIATGRVRRLYTHKGIRDDSTWTRAQAWAMLGGTVDAIWLPEIRAQLVAAACAVTDWWLAHVPEGHVARWDFDAPPGPGTPWDTSGTAIAAASMLKLSALVEDAERAQRYRDAAEATVRALVASHLTPVGDADPRPPGILTGGCYNHRIGLATNNELIWGSYYLFEALHVMAGRLEPARI